MGSLLENSKVKKTVLVKKIELTPFFNFLKLFLKNQKKDTFEKGNNNK